MKQPEEVGSVSQIRPELKQLLMRAHLRSTLRGRTADRENWQRKSRRKPASEGMHANQRLFASPDLARQVVSKGPGLRPFLLASKSGSPKRFKYFSCFQHADGTLFSLGKTIKSLLYIPVHCPKDRRRGDAIHRFISGLGRRRNSINRKERSYADRSLAWQRLRVWKRDSSVVEVR